MNQPAPTSNSKGQDKEPATPPNGKKPSGERTKSGRLKRLSIAGLLRPHRGPLFLGFLAVLGESAANLLEPWPLKIVLDNVLRGRNEHSALMRLIHSTVGDEKLAILKFACFAVLAIAALDAISSYAEKYLTISVG